MAIEWTEIRDINLQVLMQEMAADIEKRKACNKRSRNDIYNRYHLKHAEGGDKVGNRGNQGGV